MLAYCLYCVLDQGEGEELFKKKHLMVLWVVWAPLLIRERFYVVAYRWNVD